MRKVLAKAWNTTVYAQPGREGEKIATGFSEGEKEK